MIEARLAEAWQATFGEEPVGVREALERAAHGGEFGAALVAAVPDLATEPTPAVLRRWLAGRENRPVALANGKAVRFAREGHRWRVAAALRLAELAA